MSQATRSRVLQHVDSLRDSTFLPFHDFLDVTVLHTTLAEEWVAFIERIYAPAVTVGLFPSQVLDPDHSCRAMIARLILWLALHDRKPCAVETGSSCDSRRRLPSGVITREFRQTAREIEGRAADD